MHGKADFGVTNRLTELTVHSHALGEYLINRKS